MISGKFLFTLIGIILAFLAVCNVNIGQPVVENWWNSVQLTSTAVPMAKLNDGRNVAVGGNYMNPDTMGSGKFVSVPSFQAMLAPRFSNVSYGANIRYNLPDKANMASPCDPLTFGDMAKESYNKSQAHMASQIQSLPRQVTQASPQTKEGYCGNCGSGQCGGGCPPSCGKGGYGLGHQVGGGYELPSGYTNGNKQQVLDGMPASGVIVGSDLPIGTMSTVDGAGNTDQFVMYNRLMTTTLGSRKRAGGDKIRGDLAIVPCQTGWFSVYPTINTDLEPGAMNVLSGAGAGGESYNSLMNLLVSASGGTKTTFGGVDLRDSLPSYNVNMSNQMITNLKSGMADVNVSSFP